MPAKPEQKPLIQLVLQDITEDRAEGDRAHRFAELLLNVQEEERRRIAQELHDEPLQLLVHLARTLERLETSPVHGPAALAEGLEGARDQTLDIAARLRAVMAGLRPPALEQLGLVAALRGFLADIGEAVTVRTDLRVTGQPERLAPQTELGAFRIAQEAVNNVIRHAGASHLLLTLAFADGGLCLQVADDGRGFDPAAVDRQLAAGHLGLLGMRERAALAGGQLTMRSAPGGGTVIEVAFPGRRAGRGRGRRVTYEDLISIPSRSGPPAAFMSYPPVSWRSVTGRQRGAVPVPGSGSGAGSAMASATLPSRDRIVAAATACMIALSRAAPAGPSGGR